MANKKWDGWTYTQKICRRGGKKIECDCVSFLVQTVCVDASGQGRRIHRRVGLNHLQDVALCWWNLDVPGEDLWTWPPINVQRNNLVLLSCSPTEGLRVSTHIHASFGGLQSFLVESNGNAKKMVPIYNYSDNILGVLLIVWVFVM